MISGFRQFKILNCLKCQQFKGHNSGNCRLVGLLQPVARSPICVFKLKVEGRQVIKDQSNHMSASRQDIYKSPHQQFYHPRTFMGQLLWRNNKKDCSLFKFTVGNELATTARSWQLPLIYFIQRNTAKFRLWEIYSKRSIKIHLRVAHSTQRFLSFSLQGVTRIGTGGLTGRNSSNLAPLLISVSIGFLSGSPMSVGLVFNFAGDVRTWFSKTSVVNNAEQIFPSFSSICRDSLLQIGTDLKAKESFPR